MRKRERERERERKREKEREREKERKRETDRQTNKQTDIDNNFLQESRQPPMSLFRQFKWFTSTTAMSAQNVLQHQKTVQKDKREKIMVGVTRIPIEELEFLNEHPVAYGSFADVYHCKWGKTAVALKQLRRDPTTNKMDDIKLEAALCFKMRHSNIVTFYGLTKLENNFYGLVLEWADQGNLRKNMKYLKMCQKIKISLCICDGLSYMHSNQIAHRDLKPENVLLFGDKSTAKISDFGTSKDIQTFIANSGIVGTPTYWAPELTGVAKQVKQFI